jgi:hypothetical protein
MKLISVAIEQARRERVSALLIDELRQHFDNARVARKRRKGAEQQKHGPESQTHKEVLTSGALGDQS